MQIYSKFCKLLNVTLESEKSILNLEPTVFEKSLDALYNGDSNLAAFYLLQCLGVFKSDSADLIKVNLWLSVIYFLKNDRQKAIKYAFEVRKLFPVDNSVNRLLDKIILNA